MTAVLGISAFFHDSAAALIVDGQVIAAAQEERFSRIKHDASYPHQAIAYCLAEGKLQPQDVQVVGFYEKPWLKFERLIETYLHGAPRGYAAFRRAIPGWLQHKLHARKFIRKSMGSGFKGSILFLGHHEAHAASAYFASPYDEAAILTVDGVGEWQTTTIGKGRENQIELIEALHFPHSLGLLYSAFTQYAGFRVNSGEYKLMGLAPYGKPRFKSLILDHLIDLRPDGSFQLDMQYFNYCHGLSMINQRFARLFGRPARNPESPFEPHDYDVAASIQAVTEEVLIRLAHRVHERTGSKRLVMAGGVAMNCVANTRILNESPFDSVWVQPAAGDAGGALGVAWFLWHQWLGQPRICRPQEDAQHGSLLGPSYSHEEIVACLNQSQANFTFYESFEEVCERTVHSLCEQHVVGWFQGRMEFGARALGCRSILGDPCNPKMRDLLNSRIKYRESFRPFAPAVLESQAAQYFELGHLEQSPYMSFVVPVKHPSRPDTMSVFPAITHVDGSARVQTVDLHRNAQFHALLEAFHARTGCPMLINTSMNIRGEPIACTPADALQCFQMTDMDTLVIGSCILEKRQQQNGPGTSERQVHREGFAQD